jgi:tetratricopeptide (TPR) repeat protein
MRGIAAAIPYDRAMTADAPRALRALLPLAVFGLSLAAFAPALQAGFVNLDDDLNFTLNPHYRGLSPSHLAWMFTHRFGHYMPLTWLSAGVDHAFWGMNPRGYHLTNLLLHGACAAIAYALFLALLAPRRDTLAHLAAAAAALLFALHPLRTEVVAWVTQRRVLLASLFALVSAVAHVRMTRAEGAARTRWHLASVGAFALSLLSMSTAVMLPAALLALDALVLRRDAGWRALLRDQIPHAVLATAAAAMAWIAQRETTALDHFDVGVAMRAVQVPYRVFFYAAKTAVPAGLSPLYLYRPDESPFAAKFLLAALAVGALTALLVARRARWPGALAAWLAFGMLLAPTLVAQISIHFAADRYAYLASVPLAALAAAGLVRSRAALATGLAAAALLSVLSFGQTRAWHDSMSLWSQAIHVDPDHHAAYVNRGGLRLDAGDLDGALRDFDEAVRSHPRFPEARTSRALARRQRGDAAGALDDCSAAIEIRPSIHAYRFRALLRLAMRDTAGARADFAACTRLPAESPEDRVTRAEARRFLGDAAGARADVDDALRLKPALSPACDLRGRLRLDAGDAAGALADFDRAIRADPAFAPPYRNRALLRLSAGDAAAAEADLGEFLARDPRSADAHAERGVARQMLGRADDALADFDRAVELDASCVQALVGRGTIRRQRGDRAGAASDLERALALTPSDWPQRAAVQRLLEGLR